MCRINRLGQALIFPVQLLINDMSFKKMFLFTILPFLSFYTAHFYCLLPYKNIVKEKQFLYESHLATVSSLENSIKDHSNNREDKLNDLQKAIKVIKAQMQSISKELKVRLLSCTTLASTI